ncbi:carboxypeptidase-like regulatory domain-containing protein [uncultured Pseudoflavonifractor sp.]|uniref:carboxypeptidase-like regulatory domain-containing protein n=1 Tax=uncultured Pseudoflavonifractor sp. TaxID=1221379 RepID=UPI0025D28F1D|nr:carboxypeptidase-like regulatory domain-containing protein [uncultured Pseudoflavonifractor sp.]
MADTQQDLLALQYSPSFTLQGLQEENVNLTLPPAPSTFATITGTVTDGTAPIADATVKLFDSAGLPYQHTMTAADGTYTLDGIPAGTYSVAAVKDGYRMSTAVGVTVTVGSTTDIPLTCTADATLALGAIAGTLTVFGTTGTPLAGAKVTLTNAALETVATTYTAADGEFLFYDVADGVYTLRASAEGYLTTAPMTATVLAGSTVNLTMTTQVDSRTYNGTVSGIIRDQSGAAVAGCFVGLYQVTTVGGVTTEQLIAATKTNTEGKYLFGGVTDGQYLVKAKVSQ